MAFSSILTILPSILNLSCWSLNVGDSIYFCSRSLSICVLSFWLASFSSLTISFSSSMSLLSLTTSLAWWLLLRSVATYVLCLLPLQVDLSPMGSLPISASSVRRFSCINAGRWSLRMRVDASPAFEVNCYDWRLRAALCLFTSSAMLSVVPREVKSEPTPIICEGWLSLICSRTWRALLLRIS